MVKVMNEKLNILILHKMGDPRRWLSSVRDIEFCLPDYAPEHNYIVHNATLPIPDFVKDVDFHGIVLGSTFLCNRYPPSALTKTMEEYYFIKNAKAIKIAMPQDDYDCSGILERWMIDWKIDFLYTVCADHWEILYPILSLEGKIKQGYTSYISEKMIDRCRSPKEFSSRSIDVSYRSKLSYLGRMRYLKGTIGELFKKATLNQGLILDVSTHPKDTIFGGKWLEFVEDSKFVLGSNSGSSLLDPEGEICFNVNKYLAFHPRASFEEVREACFPGVDEKWSFTAISPRNIEAALLETAQICVPGTYSGIMQPEEHYIPFEPDGSNINDVLSVMRDREKVKTMTLSCKEAFLSVKELRYRNHVREIIDTITRAVSTKKIVGTQQERMEKQIKRYIGFNERCMRYYWPYQRSLKGVKKVAKVLGAKKIKELIVNWKNGTY